MRKVIILDTSILCVWFGLPGLDICGPDSQKWDRKKVQEKIYGEIKAGSVLVLPLASIIETGNHISQIDGDRYLQAQKLSDVMVKSAEEASPWAAFSDQSQLWSPEKLKEIAETWPDLATQRLSLGDATIKDVAEYYARAGWEVELFTGDMGLKSYEPTSPIVKPRRRK